MVKEKFSLEIPNKNCYAVQQFCDDLLYLFNDRHLDKDNAVNVIEQVYEWLATKDYSITEDGYQTIPVWDDEIGCF